MKPAKPEQKKGGSAIKQIKAKLAAAGVFNKLQRVSKKASQKSLQHSASNRKEAKSILKNLSQKTQVNNPFEQRFAKEKHQVVGRNMKGITGRPGQVRARNQQIRQNTLALEIKNKNRENVLVDRRFGERDPGMSTEDKMLERFMKEKTKKMKAGTSFNLEDDEEVLTHMGQSLDNITSFDEVGQDEMSGIHRLKIDDGNIDPSIVKFTHFGGFEEDKDPNVRKSRNEIMKEVIQKSKMYKKERQRQKEEDLNIAEEVDADLDTIRGLLAPITDVLPASEGKMKVSAGRLALISGKTPDEFPDEALEMVKPKADEDYDRFVREMQYDRRAKPTDRTKTEEELAQEAKEELEKLEADRINRMEGKEVEDGGKKKKFKREHRESQADDLGYEEMPKPEMIQPLTYKDGVLVNKEIFMKPKQHDSDESSDDSSESSSENEDTEDDISENESNSTDNDLEAEEGSEGNSEEFFDGIEDSRIIEHLHNKDLASENSDENYQTALEDMYDESDEESSNRAAKKKRSLESAKAASEIPYTFAAPENYEKFLELVQGRSLEDQKTIFSRILILYHTKLSKDNIKIQEKLMEIVLQHIIELGSSIPFEYEIIQFYQKQSILLCRKFPAESAVWYRSFIHALNDKLNKSLSKNPKRSAFPSPGELLILRDIADVFSTSDLQHTVVTPCMLLLAQYLEQSPIISIKDAISGLIMCNVFYRYIILSKRFVPEIMNYLNFIIIHSLDISEKQERRKIHTLKNFEADLTISDFNIGFSDIDFASIYNKVVIEEADDLRLAIFGEALVMLKLLCKLYSESSVIIELFESLSRNILKAVPDNCNEKLKIILESYKRTVLPLVESAKLKRRPLQYQKRKAIPIKTYNPKFHVGYSLDKKYDPDRDRAEQNKLKAEYKKEFKGAVRELRKDAAFLGRAKVEKIKEKDREYKKKMDKIKGILAEQEGAMRESHEERAARLALEKYINDKPNDSGLREIVEQCKPHLTFVEICSQLNIAVNETPKQKKRTYIRPYASPKFVGMPVNAEPALIPARQSPRRKRLDSKDINGDMIRNKENLADLNNKIEQLARQRVEKFMEFQTEESGIKDVVEKCKPHFTFLEICEQLAIDVDDLMEMKESNGKVQINDYTPDYNSKVDIPEKIAEKPLIVEIREAEKRRNEEQNHLTISAHSVFVNAVFESKRNLEQLLPTSFHQFFNDMLLHTALLVDPTKMHSSVETLERLYPSNVDGIDQLTSFKIRKLCEDVVLEVKQGFLAKPTMNDIGTMTMSVKYTTSATDTADLMSTRAFGVNTDKLKTQSVSTNTIFNKYNSIATNTECKQYISRETTTDMIGVSNLISTSTGDIPDSFISRNKEFSVKNPNTNQTENVNLVPIPERVQPIESSRERDASYESLAKRLKIDSDPKNISSTMKAQQGSILKDIRAKIQSDTKANHTRKLSVPKPEPVSIDTPQTTIATDISVQQKKVDTQAVKVKDTRNAQPVIISKTPQRHPKSQLLLEQEQFIRSIMVDIQRSINNDERRGILLRKFAKSMDDKYSEDGEILDEENKLDDYSTFDAETLAKAKVLKSLAK
ncbi:nucleolar complex protein 14 [Boothiomyces sp. JEL0866]|nr:nucleolar complex protein 14 [Boothiomyces sp. JEL0866]